ncbi:MAG: response regulator transcription factor [Ruminococcaceae bacterium]|nr:response regulator transcription factor [Oscillospiraceae bacterium]
MIKIALCDDNNDYIENTLKPILLSAIAKSAVIAEIYTYNDGNELIKDFEKLNGCDIVVLDIDMPALNGKEVAQKLRVLDSSFFLLFVTSYKSEIYSTIPYRINAFLPKDTKKEDMESEFVRVIGEFLRYKPSYELFEAEDKGERSTIRIALDDIFYFSCINRTIYLCTGSKKYRLYGKKLSKIADKYLNMGFFEVCRGYIVNVSKIKSVNHLDAELDNGETVPISRRKTKELLEKITDYIVSKVG